MLGVANHLIGGTLLHDHAIGHEHDLIGDLAGERHLVGHHDHGHTLIGKVAHNAQNLADHLRVERTGRLIEEHQVRVHGQRTRNSHTLLLTTGQLSREAVFLALQTNLGELFEGNRLRLSLGTAQNLNLSNRAVIQDVQVTEQVELLEHHTHVGTHAVNVYVRVGDLGIAHHDGAVVRLL